MRRDNGGNGIWRRAGERLLSGYDRAVKYIKPLRAALNADRGKRASPRASVTLEASIALPLYIFFFVNILAAFDILRMESDITAALHQTGNHIAFHAFDMKYADDVIDALTDTEAGDETGSVLGDVGTFIYSAAYAESSVRDYLGEEHIRLGPMEGGMSFLRSRIMMNADEIDLVASWRAKPFFPGIAAPAGFPMEARYFGHAWTGYEPGGGSAGDGAEDDPIVYITENGTVYHKNINCRHLKHAVRSIPAGEAADAVNNSGERYTPCEICGGYGNGRGTVYVSDGGDRIHSTVNCPGLKRTICYVHLSEVAGWPPCSLCGS